MEFHEFTDWALKGMTSGAILFGVSMLKKIQGSIEKLNVQVATVIERTTGHEKELDRHEKRLVRLESEKRK